MHLKGPLSLKPDTAVFVNGYQHTTVRKDGTFVVHSLDPADYILSFAAKDYMFPEYLVNVKADDSVHVQAHSPSQKIQSISQKSLSLPLTVRPTGRMQYVDPQASFDLYKMATSNPLYLILGFSMLFILVMPKVLSSMDPELLKEVQANQQDMHKRMAAAQTTDFSSGISSFLAGGGDTTRKPEASSRKKK